MSITYPDPFLEVRCAEIDGSFPTTGLCAGYDGGKWRSERLADHLLQWLPYAADVVQHPGPTMRRIGAALALARATDLARCCSRPAPDAGLIG